MVKHGEEICNQSSPSVVSLTSFKTFRKLLQTDQKISLKTTEKTVNIRKKEHPSKYPSSLYNSCHMQGHLKCSIAMYLRTHIEKYFFRDSLKSYISRAGFFKEQKLISSTMQ